MNLLFCPLGQGEKLLQAPGYKLNPGPPELKVLLVGRRGAGKSASGNNLLGNRVFKTKFSEGSVTQRFVSASRIWTERKAVITDAPDISSSRDLKAELQRPALGCPLALLLVMPLGSFT